MEQAVGNSLTRWPKSEEVHADMSESAGHRGSTRVNLGGGAHPCDQNQTDRGPNRLQSLAGGHECNRPTDENWRAVIIKFPGLKIDIRQAIDWAGGNTFERCVRS